MTAVLHTDWILRRGWTAWFVPGKYVMLYFFIVVVIDTLVTMSVAILILMFLDSAVS